MTLSEGARKALKHMAIANYEYQSEFARRYFALGKTEGKADLLIRLLTRRFGPLPGEVQASCRLFHRRAGRHRRAAACGGQS